MTPKEELQGNKDNPFILTQPICNLRSYYIECLYHYIKNNIAHTRVVNYTHLKEGA